MTAAMNDKPYQSWVSLGIDHDTALPMDEDPDVRPENAFSMRGHSIGGFGSVTTNKIIADLCGDLFGLSVQAYPKYGSAKKGLPTTYFLTVANERLKTHCELRNVELIALNDTNAFNLGDCLAGLSEEGTLFMHHTADSPEQAWASVPTWARRRIREKNAQVFFLDTMAIAREVAHNPSLRVRMMGVVLVGVFLKVTPFAHQHGMSVNALMQGVEKAIRDRWGKKGEQVVQDNLTCIKRGYEAIQQIPQAMIDDTTLDSPAGRMNVLTA
jgi:pyruvate-ferredoxin/flavodoxin oxidoreductase